ncbi:MAG: hypothetical protein R3297_08260, partial [Desulfobulbales bacterium]|nr:hypothetical protein [Desulfobulbales bacterium]
MERQKLSQAVKTFLWVQIILFLALAFYPLTAGAKGPPVEFPGSKRGQEAITALGDRLPEVAMRYGKSAERMRELFLQNNDLLLDPDDLLVYLCNFELGEGETPEASEGSEVATAPRPLDQTFFLHSRPGASKVIYLDFDGHTTSGTHWNTAYNEGADIVSEPFDIDGSSQFSNGELERIQEIWSRVVEDFVMYDVDVTTEDPGSAALLRSGIGDQYYGVRVVISPTRDWYGAVGGVAYIGSFNWSTDTPAFVFTSSMGSPTNPSYAKNIAEASSHETGHTLSLYHDGITGGTEYYGGHGDWAPIMGVSYANEVTQWSKGEYEGANNTEDDLAEMLTEGISYRADDHADSIGINATPIGGTTISVSGIIEEIT